MYVDDIRLAGKKQNLDPMWKLLNKGVNLEEPTSFLDDVYLGCTQRPREISKNTVDNYRTMFESRISAGAETIPTMNTQDMQRPTRLRALFLTLEAGTLPSRGDVKGQSAQNHQSPPRA